MRDNPQASFMVFQRRERHSGENYIFTLQHWSHSRNCLWKVAWTIGGISVLRNEVTLQSSLEIFRLLCSSNLITDLEQKVDGLGRVYSVSSSDVLMYDVIQGDYCGITTILICLQFYSLQSFAWCRSWTWWDTSLHLGIRSTSTSAATMVKHCLICLLLLDILLGFHSSICNYIRPKAYLVARPPEENTILLRVVENDLMSPLNYF